MIVEPQPHDMRGGGKGRVDRRPVAGLPVEAEIARHLVGDLRRAGGTRGIGRRHRGERHIIDRDQLGGVERLFARLGDDHRHRLAGIANLVRGQHRLRRKRERLAGLGIGGRGREQRLQPVGARVRGGQHREHARRGARRTRIDAGDSRMRVRRAQHDGMGQAVEGEIVEIGAAPGQKAQILTPLGPVADAGTHLAHLTPPFAVASRNVLPQRPSGPGVCGTEIDSAPAAEEAGGKAQIMMLYRGLGSGPAFEAMRNRGFLP